ncbi:hypothetical protein RJ035_000651 [Blastomyces gilchristii]
MPGNGGTFEGGVVDDVVIGGEEEYSKRRTCRIECREVFGIYTLWFVMVTRSGEKQRLCRDVLSQSARTRPIQVQKYNTTLAVFQRDLICHARPKGAMGSQSADAMGAWPEVWTLSRTSLTRPKAAP